MRLGTGFAGCCPVRRPVSEASDSFQVRTGDADGCIGKLRAAGFKGVVFRGDSGWLTVVPYGDAANPLALNYSAEGLALSLGAPVLAYSCHEDFGWAFSLALPDGRSTSFACFENPFDEDSAGPDQGEGPSPDRSLLAEVLDVGHIVRFLQPPPAVPGEGGPAYGFARTLGFPEFIWLSPYHLAHDREDALRRGGEEIG